MRIGFISDLHTDYNYRHDFRIALMKICKHDNLDYLVLGGDITTDPYLCLGFLEGLSSTVDTKILIIPGNHEKYYYHDKDELGVSVNIESHKQFYDLLLNKKYSLYKNPIITDNYVVIGHTGWYDYSFYPTYPNINLRNMHRKRKYFVSWSDCIYIDGDNVNLYSDIDETDKSIKELTSMLDWAATDQKIKDKSVCVVTHVLPLKDMLPKRIYPGHKYFKSFLGSEKYSQLFEKYKVGLSISGHSHYRVRMNKNGISYINVSLGHNFEWRNKLNVYDEIKRAIYILED